MQLQKPDFKQNLDHLGETVCYFQGIDRDKGILISDDTHAVSCHLRPTALKQFKDQIKGDIESMVGMKIIINKSAKKVDLEQ
tara:strand:+ start:199 stop:444 length:246 start_codon:yes stop_codon:yes gene_type:complete